MQCNHRKRDGTRCRASAIADSGKCLFHDPARAAERAAGRKQGGISRSKPAATLSPNTADLPLQSVADVVAALGQTINQVRTGKLAVNVGNCLGVLAGVLLKAIEGGDLEQRLAALEAKHAGRGRR
jgi:hypothetical protein